MTALVYITPKPDILDPRDLGYDEVQDVRVGKYITLELKPRPGEDPHQRLEEMCRRLLANINVESYRVEITES